MKFDQDHMLLLNRNGTTKLIHVDELESTRFMLVEYVMVNMSSTMFDDVYTLIPSDFLYDFDKFYSYEIVYGYSEESAIKIEGKVYDIYSLIKLMTFIYTLESIDLLEKNIYEMSDIGYLQIFRAKFQFDDEVINLINLKTNAMDRLIELDIVPTSLARSACSKHDYFYVIAFAKDRWYLNENEFNDTCDYIGVSNVGSFWLMDLKTFDVLSAIEEDMFQISEYDTSFEKPLSFNKVIYTNAFFEAFSFGLYSSISLIALTRRIFHPNRYTTLEYRAYGYDSVEKISKPYMIRLSNKDIDEEFDFIKSLKENIENDKEVYLY